MGAMQQMLMSYKSASLVYATWNPADKSPGVTLLNGDLTAAVTTSPSDGGTVRSTIGKSTGKFYFEFIPFSSYATIGVANQFATVAAQTFPGIDSNGWCYYGLNGAKYNGSGPIGYGQTFGVGDTIGVAFDLTNSTLEFFKNGVSQGVAFSNLSGQIFAATGNYTINETMGTARFGASGFVYPAPPGYTAGLFT